MILCSDECVPCCDYCIYAIHEEIEVEGNVIKGGPIGCKKNSDEKHQEIAQWSGYCKDFHCINAREKEQLQP